MYWYPFRMYLVSRIQFCTWLGWAAIRPCSLFWPIWEHWCIISPKRSNYVQDTRCMFIWYAKISSFGLQYIKIKLRQLYWLILWHSHYLSLKMCLRNLSLQQLPAKSFAKTGYHILAKIFTQRRVMKFQSFLMNLNICDTIKGNESHVGNVQFWVFNIIYLSI